MVALACFVSEAELVALACFVSEAELVALACFVAGARPLCGPRNLYNRGL